MTAGDHFERVAVVYESLRTTDEAPVRAIGQFLPGRPVTGLDVGCGTGRYTRLLRALLPDGSRLAAADVSAAMLAQLRAASRGHAGGVVPPRRPPNSCRSDRQPGPGHRVQLRAPLRPRPLPGRRRPGAAARRPAVHLHRTPQQNARTIWGRYFPGFTEHEQRLHSQAALRTPFGGPMGSR